jgi:PAS domain S-box-containing protein
MILGVYQPPQSDSYNRSSKESDDRVTTLGAHADQSSPVNKIPKSQNPGSIKNANKEGNRILSGLVDYLPEIPYRYRFDNAWKIEFIGKGCAKLIGYSYEDLIENQIIGYKDLIHPDDYEIAREQIAAAVQKNAAYDLKYRLVTRSGEFCWVRDIGKMVQTKTGKSDLLEGFIIDITGHLETERQVKSQLRRFEALRTIDTAITASYDLRVTFDIILQEIALQLGVDAADVLLLDKVDQTLKYVAGRGFKTESLQSTNLRLGEGYAGQAALEKRLVRVADLTYSSGGFRRSPYLVQEGFISYLGVPLIARGQVKGILELFQRSPLDPDGEWLDFMNALAGQAAIAVDNASLLNELQRSNTELVMAYDATLEGWSRALEMRELGTEGHNGRVTDLTLRMAQALAVKESELIHIRRGALLHDIGKLAVPDRILFNTFALSEEDWQVMRLHPVYAYQLLSPIPELRTALDIPYCHHEKWDGSGYPRGLKENQIPIAARIFAVVDVWDALLSDRPFRPAWDKNKTLDYLRGQSGKHFDPEIMWAFLQMIG